MPFMDEAEDGADEDVEDTEDEPTSLIALFLKKHKTAFFVKKRSAVVAFVNKFRA